MDGARTLLRGIWDFHCADESQNVGSGLSVSPGLSIPRTPHGEADVRLWLELKKPELE